MTEAQGYVLIVLSIGMLILLAIWVLSEDEPEGHQTLVDAIDTAAERFTRKIEQHAELNVVRAVLRDLQSQPELIDRLADYAREVVAAQLIVYMNDVAATHQHASEKLKEAERSLNYHPQDGPSKNKVEMLKELQRNLLRDLQAAEQLAQQYGVAATS
jgi:hypothetical protein